MTLVALFAATIDVGVEADFALGFDRTAALESAADNEPAEPHERGAPAPEEPAPYDELDGDDDTTTMQPRELAPAAIAGEIDFLPGDVAATSEWAEELFRPPIA